MLRAKVPRSYIDLNREPYELDPRMFVGELPGYANTGSPRVAGGLGTIPRIVSEGEEIYRERRSLFWKKMQIVRGCDPKRNVLVYLSYTDRLIEGSPQNSTSTVPVMPWGSEAAPKCGDFVNP
jgi:hypothetical protein